MLHRTPTTTASNTTPPATAPRPPPSTSPSPTPHQPALTPKPSPSPSPSKSAQNGARASTSSARSPSSAAGISRKLCHSMLTSTLTNLMEIFGVVVMLRLRRRRFLSGKLYRRIGMGVGCGSVVIIMLVRWMHSLVGSRLWVVVRRIGLLVGITRRTERNERRRRIGEWKWRVMDEGGCPLRKIGVDKRGNGMLTIATLRCGRAIVHIDTHIYQRTKDFHRDVLAKPEIDTQAWY
jgi:hypothetical protein